MKRMLLSAFGIVLSVAVVKAQTQGALHYVYGIDFSEVKVSGAKETETNEKFAQAFIAINTLLISEPESYDFSRMLGGTAAVVLEPLFQKLEDCDYSDLRQRTPVIPKIDAASVVKGYVLPQTSGYGVVLVAKLLDKISDKAFYDLVVFDIATRNVLIKQEVSGNAGGFGLRNFWAASVRDVLKKTKLYKKQK